MPEFRYTGSDARTYYPPGQPAVHVKPGETCTLAKDPGDGRWEKKRESARSAANKRAAKKAAPKTETKPDPAPAGESKE